MVKRYKVIKKRINMGEHKGETVYSLRPVSYGTLTTDDAARQISVESAVSPADVKAVLDRYANYVRENLIKGYDIEMLGFGKLYVRFINGKAATNPDDVNRKMIKSIVPCFRPSYKKLPNGKRSYDLLPGTMITLNVER